MIVAVYGSARATQDSPLYAQARSLGSLLAQAGLTVMTGGYGGTMEAVSRGAFEQGGRAIGVSCAEIEAFRACGPNAYLTEVWPSETLNARIDLLTREADLAVALPGGIGTLAELSMVANLIAIHAVRTRGLILVGEGWRATFEAFLSGQEAYISDAFKKILFFAMEPEEVVALSRNLLREE